MKFQKRNSVFETNSSSVHSLTIDSSGRRPNKIKMKDGYLQAKFGVFDCSGRFTTQEEKLSYLATVIWYLDGDLSFDLTGMYESYSWELLERAVKDYVPDCKGVRIIGERRSDPFSDGAPYLDHQSVPNSEYDCIIDLYDEDAVIDFIWNDYVGLKCSRD